MDFDGHCRIRLSPGAAADALLSAPVLAACIAPRASLTPRADGGFDLSRRVVFGGTVLALSGVLRVDVQQAPLRCLLTVEGNAGNAGFGVVRLLVALQPSGRRGCSLRYHAEIETGGVLVQMEPAPIDAALRSGIVAFFARFAERAGYGAPSGWRALRAWEFFRFVPANLSCIRQDSGHDEAT